MKKTIFLTVLALTVTVLSFAQTAEAINAAINSGDCAALYAYIGKGSDGTDPKLVASAAAAIKRYTAIDSVTLKYRTDKMDSRVRNVGKDLMEKVFVDPAAALPDVTAKLVAGVKDQFLRAKALHDWICDNISYDVETAFARANRRQDYVSVLKNKKAVCAGYTNLFNEMCKIVNIESIGITGYSKGFGYRGYLGDETDHAWNGVKINGKWYLVDVTWDAGYVDQRTYIKNYSTGYLFLDSRPFLYSHLPAEGKFQFFAPLVTKEEFVKEPLIRGVYFKYGLELKSDKPGYNNVVDGAFSFDIILKNANVSLSNELRNTQQRNVPGASWMDRSGTALTLHFDVPDNSEYQGHVFARLKNEQNIQDRIDVNTFEGRLLAGLAGLLAEKKITEKESDLFKASYFKVQENNCYYFMEDQFDAARNNAALKIHKLLELPLDILIPVLDFNLKAAQGYPGFKTTVQKKYPDAFTAFENASNTRLVSPLKGELKAGSTELFFFESRDYSRFAVIINGQFTFFEKTPAGNFELSFTIPGNLKELQIFGTKNNRNYEGLIKYDIIDG